MDWEWWIMSSNENTDYSRYDFLCELAVSSYKLNKKSRKADLKDTVQFFILWWKKNKKQMKKYNTLVSIAGLLCVDHTTIIHYIKRRKPTIMYEENTKCINDFLNS